MSSAASRPPVHGIAFLVAGAAIVVAIFAFVTPFLPSRAPLFFVVYAAVAVALGSLALTVIRAQAARTATIVAAVAWGLLAVLTVAPMLPTGLSTVVEVVALLATLGSGVLLFARRELSVRSTTPYLVFSVAAALYLSSEFIGFAGQVAALVTITFGVTAIVIGYYLVRRL